MFEYFKQLLSPLPRFSEIKNLIENKKYIEVLEILDSFEQDSKVNKKTLTDYKKLCVEGFITDIYEKATKCFTNKQYNEASRLSKIGMKAIIDNCEYLDMDRKLLVNFCEQLGEDMKDKTSIPISGFKDFRDKHRKRATELFVDVRIGSNLEMLVDLILMPAICNSFSKD